MKYTLSILLFLSLFFVGCSDSKDEPTTETALSFKLLCDNAEDVAISDSGKDAFIATTGNQTYIFTIQGDFANIVFDSSISWASASCSNKVITVKVTAPDNFEDDATGHIDYTIFNDSKSASGKISISYKYVAPPSPRDIEQMAIDYFLSDKIVNKDCTHEYMKDNNFEIGESAPYYYNDPAPVVAFKVLKKGNSGKVSNGDKIYFRYTRWNLMDNYVNHAMPSGYGNANDLSSDPSYFYLEGSDEITLNWGVGIQVPMMFGLEYGSEVDVIVASPAAGQNEASLCIPYLYHITYLKGEDSDQHVLPNSPVYIPFNSEADWYAFGATSPGEWKLFDKKNGTPSGYNYNDITNTGFGGIIIVHDFEGNILAYDAACPVERDANVVLYYETRNFEAVCPKCGSHFHLFDWPGIPVSGEAAQKGYGMKRYTVIRNTGSEFITIVN